MRRRGISLFIYRIRARPIIAAIVVTLLSLALIGGVVLRVTLLRSVAVRPSPTLSACAAGVGNLSPTCTVLSSSPTIAPSPYLPYSPPATPPNPPTASNATPPYPPFYGSASAAATYSVPALNCRLPVYAGAPGSGGFIVFPGGTFVADPTSAVTLPSPSPGGSTPSPYYGYGPPPALSYDRQFMRWLPVQQPWVAPDGSHYAYLASDGIYAVSVPSGTQTEAGEGQGWTIVAVQNDGVFAGKQNAPGLWLLPYSGSSRQLTTSGFWQAASSTAAYGTATSAVPQGATNTIMRLDVKTGKTTDWFSRPDAISTVIGFDTGGNPIITASYTRPGGGTDYWVANDATSAFIIGGSSEFYPSGAPIADPNGVWFSAGGAVIFDVAGPALYVMAAIGGQLAGGCY